MVHIKDWLHDYLLSLGLSEAWVMYINTAVLLVGLLVLVFLIDFIIRKILLNAFTRFAKSTKSIFDDILIKNKVPRNISHIVPFIIAIELAPIVFSDFPYMERIIEKGLWVFAILLALWLARSLLNSFKGYFKTLPNLRDKPIDSYIQVFLIFTWILGILTAVAIITEIKFWNFLTSLGAVSAIIVLIFKDSILGFVASIQVSINDMVRIGDWITFEKYGADGDVVEINLATVKVQNFDKTITTIPTYALISDSFKNWRGMMESGGRRIKRALYIKMTSIKYLTHEDVDRLKNVQLIEVYLEKRQADIASYNEQHQINKKLMLNGRNLTNLGVFRKYIETYVEHHSAINKDMMIMTRQLEPTTQGIPLEIYAFSSDKRWENYEYIMADIFDHIIAAVPYFDLELFELRDVSH